MRQTNFIIIRGNLVRSPETRELPSGDLVAEFRIANNRSYTKDGEKQEKTCFIDCQSWGKSAEFVRQYVASGDQVQVLGELEYREWVGKNEEKRSGYRVNAREVELIRSKADGTHAAAAPAPVAKEEENDSDLPF